MITTSFAYGLEFTCTHNSSLSFTSKWVQIELDLKHVTLQIINSRNACNSSCIEAGREDIVRAII